MYLGTGKQENCDTDHTGGTGGTKGPVAVCDIGFDEASGKVRAHVPTYVVGTL